MTTLKYLSKSTTHCFRSNSNILKNLSNFIFYIGEMDNGEMNNSIQLISEINKHDMNSGDNMTQYICLPFPAKWIEETVLYIPWSPLIALPFFSQYNTYDLFIISHDIQIPRIFCKKIEDVYYIIQKVSDKDNPKNTDDECLLWRPHGYYIDNQPINYDIEGHLTIMNIETKTNLYNESYPCLAHHEVYSNSDPQIKFKEVWDQKDKFHLYYVEYTKVIVNKKPAKDFKGYFKLIHEKSIDDNQLLQINFENFFNVQIIKN